MVMTKKSFEDSHYANLQNSLSVFFCLASRHSVAVAQMGNYQDYLKQTNPLRELDPGMNRAHMFGNPFKLAKDQVGYKLFSNFEIDCYYQCDQGASTSVRTGAT